MLPGMDSSFDQFCQLKTSRLNLFLGVHIFYKNLLFLHVCIYIYICIIIVIKKNKQNNTTFLNFIYRNIQNHNKKASESAIVSFLDLTFLITLNLKYLNRDIIRFIISILMLINFWGIAHLLLVICS